MPPTWSSLRGVAWSWPALLVHSLLVQVITFSARPATTYRAIELSVPTAALGVLSGCFAVAPLVLAWHSGVAVDRFGERRLALVGGVALVAAPIVLAAATGVAGLVAGTTLLGVGHLWSLVAQQTWVANHSGNRTSDSAFGWYAFAASLGQAVGPGTIALTGEGSLPDTAHLFRMSMVVGALVLATSLLLGSSGRASGAERSVASALPSASAARVPGLTQAVLASSVILAATDVAMVYVPVLGTERGVPAAFVGVLLAGMGVAGMSSRLFLGPLVARYGRRRVLIVGTLVAGSALLVGAVSSSVWALAACLATAGLGLGVGQPLTMSWIADSVTARARGRAMSLRLMGNRAGQILIPSLAGVVAAGAGAAGVLAATSVSLYLVASLATGFLRSGPETAAGVPEVS